MSESTVPPSLPPEFHAFMQRTSAIAQLTDDEQVRQFWMYWGDRTPGRLDLVVSAYINWDSKLKREVDVGIGWLRPTVTDPVDAETSFHLPLAEHEYGAGVPIEDAQDVKTGLRAIHESIARANLLTDGLSLLTGFSASWLPARVLPVLDKPETFHDGKERRYRKYCGLPDSQKSTSAMISDQFVADGLASFLRLVWGLKPKVREVLTSAISWQAQANRIGGFSRYLHYWASVELLAGFFWSELPRDQTRRVPESEVRQRVLENLLDLRGENYIEILKKCHDVLEPSARTQVKALARLIDFDADVFFKRANKDAKSILDVRNDIAHGNVANNDRSYAGANRGVLNMYQDKTREFVIRVALAAAKGIFQI